MNTSKLVVAGLVIIGAGLALLGYLDPVIRILFFGTAAGGGSAFVRSGSSSFTFTGGAGSFAGGAAAGGRTPLISLETIIVFVVMVIGLLLTIAGTFSAGGGMPKTAPTMPAAKSLDSLGSRADRLGRHS